MMYLPYCHSAIPKCNQIYQAKKKPCKTGLFLCLYDKDSWSFVQIREVLGFPFTNRPGSYEFCRQTKIATNAQQGFVSKGFQEFR